MNIILNLACKFKNSACTEACLCLLAKSEFPGKEKGNLHYKCQETPIINVSAKPALMEKFLQRLQRFYLRIYHKHILNNAEGLTTASGVRLLGFKP